MDVDRELLCEPKKEQMIDSLLKSSAKIPQNILDTDPHPSDLTLALFSSAVYTEREPEETFADYGEGLVLPEGWSLLAFGSNRRMFKGYFGMAFVNIKLQQVVVAHRGIDQTSSVARLRGIIVNYGTGYTACVNSAITFVDIIRQVILSTNANHGRKYNLVLTGHSLGGWLAQLTVFTVEWLKITNDKLLMNTSGVLHAKAVVFDSPGAKAILNKIRNDYFDRTTDMLKMLDITEYIRNPDSINFCEHIGTMYCVSTDVSDFSVGSSISKLLSFNWISDSIDEYVNILKQLSPNRSQVLNQSNVNEYKSALEGKSLTKDSECLDKMMKGSQVVFSGPQPQSFLSHFKVLSKNEVELLDQLAFIQKQADVRIFNEFILSKNLVIENDELFPVFEIDNFNQTIICESEELLEQFINRLKQLVRWLGIEFADEVKKQKTDIIYYNEGRTYLNKIEKIKLKFTDSIGLRGFLLSKTERVFSIVTQGGEEDSKFEIIRLLNVFSQIKESVSNRIHKYTAESNYNFLDITQLQTLYNRNGSPNQHNSLLMVDGSSFSTTNSEDFLNNFIQCSPPNFEKLIFISSKSIDVFNSFENTKTFIADRKINLMDFSNESQEIISQRTNLILTENCGFSLQEFLGTNCSLSDINQLVSSDCLKRIVTNEEYRIIMYDTCPMISDHLMIKTNIKTSMKHVMNCVDLHDTLVVISGESSEDLSENLAKKIILVKGDVERIFKDICKNNQHKTIYHIEVSEEDVYCKIIFNHAFYIPRKFIHEVYIDLRKFVETQHSTNSDLFVICGEKHSPSVRGFEENCMEREAFSKKFLIAETKKQEVDIIETYFDKNIHFVNICEKDELSEGKFDGGYESVEKRVEKHCSYERHERLEEYQSYEYVRSELRKFELEKYYSYLSRDWFKKHQIKWQYSYGSVESLHSYISKNSRSIDEVTLTQIERNLVIVIDQPGVGKTTTLANLSRLVKSAWVIYIDLKQFRAYLERLSEKLTPQNVATFLLSECPSSTDGCLAHSFLEYLLQSKKSNKRVILMFDGFDELYNYEYLKNKKSSMSKLVQLLIFLQSKPAIQVYLMTQKYLKEFLETQLSQFSTSFITINTKEQQEFLYKFWRSFLPLELGSNRVEAEIKLEEYSGEVLRQTERVFGSEMSSFTGVPLQLRMLAEVFRPQSDLLVFSPEVFNKLNFDLAPGLYKKYIELKYNIYLHDKKLVRSALGEDEITEYFEKLHGELGFRTFFTEFYNSNQQHFEDITESTLIELNKIGLIQSKKKGDFEFRHKTYAEYYCAYMVVRWLNHKERFPQDSTFKGQLIKNILLPQILMQPDSKLIRYFINYEFEGMVISDATLKLNSEHISQLWNDNNTIFRNRDHETALHIAVQERNVNIIKLLLSGLNVESTRLVLASFIIQFDVNNQTALHIPDKHPIRFGETILNLAANQGHLDVIELLLLNGADVNSTNTAGDCALNVAARKGHLHIIKYLLEKGADVHNRNNAGETALNVAASQGHLDVIELLLEKGADVNSRNNAGETALNVAARKGHLHIIKYLLEKDADVNSTNKAGDCALNVAASQGHLYIIKSLLEKGADVHSRNNAGETTLIVAASQTHLEVIELLLLNDADLNSTNNAGETALNVAVRQGHLDIIELLLEKGANVNSRNNAGETALNVAARKGHLHIIKYLLEKDADVNSTNKAGDCALNVAASQGHLYIIKSLLEKGADVHIRNNAGETTLIVAASQTHLEVIELLLLNGADLNSTNNAGETALNVAVRQGHLDVIKLLHLNSADVNSTKNASETALNVAASQGHLSVIKFLVDSGAKINTIDNSGRTPLHMAAQGGHLPVIKYFVKNGADINHKDNNGRTSLLIATLTENSSIVEYLIDRGAEINYYDNRGMNAVCVVAVNNNLPMLKFLIKNGADINTKNDKSASALYLAVSNDNFSVVKCLIENDAKINFKNDRGMTALHIAVLNDNLSIVKYLIDSGADISSTSYEGETALYMAAGRNNLSIVKHLIESGVEINYAIKEGETAMYIAASRGHVPVVEYLLQNGANPDKTDGLKRTALTVASYNLKWDVVLVLLEKGADVNVDGGKSFRWAILDEEWPVVKSFVDKGACVYECAIPHSYLSEFKRKFSSFEFKK